MVKDRLAEFQRRAGQNRTASFIRSRTSTEDTVTIRLESGLPAANEHLLEEEEWKEMDLFLKTAEVIRAKVAEMNSMMCRLREVHRIILISPGVESEITDELSDIIMKFKELSRSVSGFIQGINRDMARNSSMIDAGSRIKRDQAQTLTRTFQDALVEFNNEQVHYKEQCEKKISSYLKIAGLQMDQDEVDEAIEKGTLFNTTSIMMAERDKMHLFDDMRSRHKEILKLEASIRELHEIFQDMAMLIESQGEIVDRIETNIENAAEYTGRAVKSVSHAQRAKDHHLKLKVGLAVCAVITILVLLFIVSSLFCLYLPFICR